MIIGVNLRLVADEDDEIFIWVDRHDWEAYIAFAD